MESLSIHLAPLPRVLPAELSVQHIGLVRKSSADHIHKAFTTCNISLILEGSGTYRWQDREAPVVAPGAFLQLPGQEVDYGPDQTGWTELFLIYSADSLDALRCRGLIDPVRPCWEVTSSRFGETVQELIDLLRSRPLRGHADRVDAACQRVLTETHLGGRPTGRTPADEVVRRLRRQVEQRLRNDHDLEALAAESGLSPTHFRRLWKDQVGVAPVRHLANLRLRQACRDLVETTGRIGAIATALGYDDQLYFARRFRAFTGMSPSEYRERYRQVLG